jgi:hypothetical protein
MQLTCVKDALFERFGQEREIAERRITDRRRKRELAANPAFEKPGASDLRRGVAVRMHGVTEKCAKHFGGPDRGIYAASTFAR